MVIFKPSTSTFFNQAVVPANPLYIMSSLVPLGRNFEPVSKSLNVMYTNQPQFFPAEGFHADKSTIPLFRGDESSYIITAVTLV